MFFVLAAAALAAPPSRHPKTVPATRPSAKDAELAKRLLGEGGSGHDSLKRMLSLMDDAGERLTARYDSSDETQGVQARALKALDDAIIEARRNQSQSRASGKGQKGEARTAGRRSVQPPSGAKPGNAKVDAAQAKAGQPAGAGQKHGSPATNRAELRRGWGYLPQRDREAIVQGAGEEFLMKYRAYIEDYYRAIAEKAEQDK